MGDKVTNFSLSHAEQQLLSDVTFFKSKIALTGHISELFGLLENIIHEEVLNHSDKLPQSALLKRGKISRGENYLGLPYMVLDHPAVFSKDGVMAFRTMMWWGNPFTCTFHLSGKFLEKLNDNFGTFQNENAVFVCINESQWLHHNDETNYITLASFKEKNGNWKAFAKEKGFLKAAIRIPISQSENLVTEVLSFINEILKQIR